MKFNRFTVLYAEANFRAKSRATGSVHNALEAAAEAKATSKMVADAGKITYISGTAVSTSRATAKIEAPVYASAEIKSSSSFSAESYKIVYAEAEIKAVSKAVGQITTDAFIQAEAHAHSSFSAFANKTMGVSVAFRSKSLFKASANVSRSIETAFKSKSSFRAEAILAAVEVISFEGLNFSPGDIIQIDLCNQYAEMNGINIMDKWSGDFFKLYPNNNLLIWHDDINKRAIEMRIRYQNRYL